MSTFKLPLSGDVVQSFSSWSSFLSPVGSQFGLININLGQSSAPKVEEDMLSDVGSYGKQIGRIGDALIVLLAHFHPPSATAQGDARRGRRGEGEARPAGAVSSRRLVASRISPSDTPGFGKAGSNLGSLPLHLHELIHRHHVVVQI